MCEPTTMAYAAMAIAAVGTYAQNEQAKAQTEAMQIQADNEAEEQQAATEEQLGERIKAAREARARARVAAGESGAMGQSFAAIINQSIQDQDQDVALAAKNLTFQKRAIDDRLNTGLSQVRRVGAAEAGLTIAGAGMDGYTRGLSLKSAREGAT